MIMNVTKHENLIEEKYCPLLKSDIRTIHMSRSQYEYDRQIKNLEMWVYCKCCRKISIHNIF